VVSIGAKAADSQLLVADRLIADYCPGQVTTGEVEYSQAEDLPVFGVSPRAAPEPFFDLEDSRSKPVLGPLAGCGEPQLLSHTS
jgi:hypothetical protein